MVDIAKNNTPYFALRETFGPFYGNGDAWNSYKAWSKLHHLKEVVSLDTILNGDLIDTDTLSDSEWENVMSDDDKIILPLYSNFDFVLIKSKLYSRSNLLSVVIEPEADCRHIEQSGFEFVGYDLLDKDYNISALTNCGGFDESFLPDDLNDFGLIDDFEKAYSTQEKLFENNPGEHHADTNVIAIWRHKTFGP